MSEQQFYENILESISDGVFTIDQDWKITSFNKAAERITGVARQDAIGQNCFEVFKSNMCESSCPLRRTLETGVPLVDRRGYCINQQGERVPISVSTAILHDASGTPIGGAETFRDLSELETLKKELEACSAMPAFTSKSEAMERVLEMLPAVADSPTSVLILGETGTGKEVLARTIHSMSPRREESFIAINCAAIPEDLLESELFGYKKGAFTGAERDKPGRFALADEGTLFLDEIGEMPPALQVKLLRVLQEKEYEPLGGTHPVKTNFRLICATHADLLERCADGRFRKDLYYRINVITMQIPPLRERAKDIPGLALQFLDLYKTQMNRTIDGFTPEVFAHFLAYDWPGNIRELENVVERMVVLAEESMLGVELLPLELVETPSGAVSQVPTGASGASTVGAVSQVRDEAEKLYILEILAKNGGNRSATAAELGINTTTLWRKLKKFGV